jgi:uncharacterized protein involved in response to NO
MTAIPRYRAYEGPAILSAGFRPFFFAASIWAALAMPLWLAAYTEGFVMPTRLAPSVWHAHEMIFGFAAASVAGFLLTAIPNWTGRMPLQGAPLASLVLLWAIGRVGVLLSAEIGAAVAAVADLCFPAAFLVVVAREIVVGRHWRNLPMLGALTLLLFGNLLVHLAAPFSLTTPSGIAALNAEVTRQATMVAYIDDFRLMMWIVLASLPLLLLLREARRRPPPTAAAPAAADD